MATNTTRLRYSFNGIPMKYRPDIRTTEESARGSQSRSVVAQWVVDVGVFGWILCCPADAARLERGGFNIV